MIKKSDLSWCVKQFGLLTISTLACTSQPPPPEATPAASPSEGITGMSRGSPDLRTPPSAPEGETWVYQLGLPFQVDQDTAGSFCNIRVSGVKGTDFENGSDVILFQDFSNVTAEGAIPITRNHNETNPNSKPPNQEAIMVKYPVMGGFVPLDRGPGPAEGVRPASWRYWMAGGSPPWQSLCG